MTRVALTTSSRWRQCSAAERCIAGNLEYHIARWKHGHDGESPPQAGVLRERFGLDR